MGRQHPRDLFDVLMLLNAEGISRDIYVGFLTYMLGHPRPINEVMAPNWKALDDAFKSEFDGMTFEAVTLEALMAVRAEVAALQKDFTKKDYAFLLSFKQGCPDWSLFDYPAAAELPAIRWKLHNIGRLAENPQKHSEQLARLGAVLDDWLAHSGN